MDPPTKMIKKEKMRTILGMCGRFSRFIGSDSIQTRYHIPNPGKELYPRSYNVAPTHKIPVVERKKTIQISGVIWGYPAKFLSGKPIINARSESLLRKSMFATFIKSNRCLVPATGFYEWKAQDGIKVPFHIRVQNNEIFSLAGIIIEDDILHTRYTVILTTEPNHEMMDIHDRMPVILKEDDEDAWITQNTSMPDIMDLMVPYQGGLNITEVSRRVNSPVNDDPEVLIKENKNNDQTHLDDFF